MRSLYHLDRGHRTGRSLLRGVTSFSLVVCCRLFLVRRRTVRGTVRFLLPFFLAARLFLEALAVLGPYAILAVLSVVGRKSHVNVPFVPADSNQVSRRRNVKICRRSSRYIRGLLRRLDC